MIDSPASGPISASDSRLPKKGQVGIALEPEIIKVIVVVEPNQTSKPIGVARANDILQLRWWLMDEESRDLPGDVEGKLKGS